MTELVKYEAACRAVADAVSIDEAKDFRDKSEAMRAYAKQAKNKQLEVQAAEIRIRAERRIGELMAGQKDSVGTAQGRRSDLGFSETQVENAPITLAEAGIDKNLADRARKYAAIPEEEFNGIVGDWKGRVEQENERVTVNLLAAGDRASDKSKPAVGRQEPEIDPETAKLRREVGKLTTEAMIDEIIGLRADLSESKAKASDLKAEVAKMKEQIKDLSNGNRGAAISNLHKQLQSAKYARDEAMAATKREEYKRKKAEARVKELEGVELQF